MRERVFGRVEDAVTREYGWEDDAGGRELVEIADLGLSMVDRERGNLNVARTYRSRMSRTSSRGMTVFTQR